MNVRRVLFSTLLILLTGLVSFAGARQEGQTNPTSIDSATVAHKLSSPNPLERRAAAEELARLAATEHRRLVEGYRVQEKDSRVRLAMDWALYRMGKNESLFQ